MTLPEQSLASCWCGDLTCTVPYGFCHCGCGGLTAIAKWGDRRWGTIKGLPYKYLKGHGNRIIPTKEPAVPFKIDGVYCRLVPIGSSGFYTIINEVDYDRVMQFHWTQFHPGSNTYYVTRNLSRDAGAAPGTQYLHDFLMEPPEGMFVDHHNRNGLDNRRLGVPRGNLRLATPSQNSANGKYRGGISGYKGAFPTRSGRFASKTWIDGKQVYFGVRDTAKEAHDLYMERMRELHGEFARDK